MGVVTALVPTAVAPEVRGISRWLGWSRKRRHTSVDDASFHMLRLRRVALETQLQCIDAAALQSEAQKNIWNEIRDLLEAASRTRADELELEWDAVYKAEKMLCLLFNGGRLRQEIQTRLQQLVIEQVPSAERLRSEYQALVMPARDGHAALVDEVTLHAFLLRVMDAIHECARKKNLARPIRKEATKIILVGVFIAFVLMIAPYVLVNFGNKTEISKWWSLFALYTALTSGALGAFFSRLISLQRQWSSMSLDEVFLHRDFLYTLLRAGVGVCGALIAYFFLRSGIIEGALFPDFAKVAIKFVDVEGPASVPMSFVMPSEDLALLTFWCFLAGFSEALVPSILANTERQFAEASSPPARRAR